MMDSMVRALASIENLYDMVQRLVGETTLPQRNPEQDVLDDIDRLVTDSMKRGMRRNYCGDGSPVCPVCEGDWHGLPGNGVTAGKLGCPGEYGTPAEKRSWREGLSVTAFTWLPGDDDDDESSCE